VSVVSDRGRSALFPYGIDVTNIVKRNNGRARHHLQIACCTAEKMSLSCPCTLAADRLDQIVAQRLRWNDAEKCVRASGRVGGL
jgi:hypothetical protein